jgi:hypothetical protein
VAEVEEVEAEEEDVLSLDAWLLYAPAGADRTGVSTRVIDADRVPCGCRPRRPGPVRWVV